MQGAVDGLMRQISALAAPGSRICFDALHRDHMDGRVHNRGFSCGVEVRTQVLCRNHTAMLGQSCANQSTDDELSILSIEEGSLQHATALQPIHSWAASQL